ncbi:SUF system NifU family Fe-S cluster assembly protein [Leucobacter allii]|uniref:SUF system NifU family Fe-S cluster assembly protein n=1 Tax=Leucobacter allii TaxID=2932247 RepID=A0ABY4FJK0_9MICO|nr:SUF system NifU family Fe-S cluster assembly protein [Leucobacter allii]UOQ56172.1 SUF system NifU family Fe-S cluster assembly protein [Leucobacter allii]UOR00639.1 SUF system NifU family Fe-S cluster assembly protein [Leucobacter allii]
MSALDGLYQELILDHSKRPVGKGPLDAPAGDVTASHHEFNPSCGDEIDLSIAVDPATGAIDALAWEGQGCSISMASASILSQLVRDERLTVDDARARIGAFREMIQSRGDGEPDEELLGDAIALQGVSKFVMRVKCAMLGWVALEADLAQVEVARA